MIDYGCVRREALAQTIRDLDVKGAVLEYMLKQFAVVAKLGERKWTMRVEDDWGFEADNWEVAERARKEMRVKRDNLKGYLEHYKNIVESTGGEVKDVTSERWNY